MTYDKALLFIAAQCADARPSMPPSSPTACAAVAMTPRSISLPEAAIDHSELRLDDEFSIVPGSFGATVPGRYNAVAV